MIHCSMYSLAIVLLVIKLKVGGKLCVRVYSV